METMYDRIKKLRTQFGWSQEELAKKVGYADKTSIAKIEAGKIDLPQSKIVAFSAAFSTTPSYLLDGDNEATEKNSLHTIAAHFDGNEYTEDELDEIRHYAEYIKSKRK